jgi:hypothetical protein
MLLVVGALVSLVVRTRRATGEARAQLMWPTGVAAVLVVMIVATPFGESLLGSAWSLVFLLIVGAPPMALLAGVVRYPLFEVDLYVARTLAVGVVVGGVVAAYAAIVWIVDRRGTWGQRAGRGRRPGRRRGAARHPGTRRGDRRC